MPRVVDRDRPLYGLFAVARVGACVLLHIAIACGANAAAQDLPVASYSMGDGLPFDSVSRLLRDPSGPLWIATPTALARFDGQNFTTFGSAEGLDVGTGVNAMQFDRQGQMWIATNGSGVFQFDLTTTERARRFIQFKIAEGRAANRVNAIAITDDGNLWAGTDAGLYAARRGGDQFVQVPLPLRGGAAQDAIQVAALAADRASMWVGTTSTLYSCRLDGSVCAEGPSVSVRSLLFDSRGDLWIGGEQGVHVLSVRAANPQLVTIDEHWSVRTLSAGTTEVFASTLEGTVVAILGSAATVLPTAISLPTINDIVEDAAHNLWVATQKGLFNVKRQGFTLYSSRHGVTTATLRTVRGAATGRIYAFGDDLSLYHVQGDRVTRRLLRLPSGVRPSAWIASSLLVDRSGDVWLGTSSGLFRYSSSSFADTDTAAPHPAHTYSRADGLAGDHVSELFEDSNGDIWIATTREGGATLSVWRRAAARFERFGAAQGFPTLNQPMGFVEDGEGAIWAGLREGGVIRIREGIVTVYGAQTGFPPLVTSSFVDRAGTLWVGGSDALVRVDVSHDPIRVTPALTGLGTRVLAIQENHSGQIIAGTTEGVLALEPATGGVRRFSRFHGVPPGPVNALARDRDGAILMVAGSTLVRWVAGAAGATHSNIRCVFTAINAGGQGLGIQWPGIVDVPNVDVPAGHNAIEVEFLGLSPELGEPLTYSYRLIGASDAWTTAPQRRVAYAGLAPGRYTFEVRVSGIDTSVSSAPARLTFTVLPPWYRRWWFVSSFIAATMLVAYAAHRARLAAAVRTERLRSRIATDLHDDIGSSLSQIAILAEVARRRAGADDAAVVEPLASIAATSRDLVEAMSDIVWAVNPHTDSLSDLVQRMRRFAEETLGAADIALTFVAPSSDIDLRMGADVRREVYLILKESVNNIARHSRATAATVDFAVTRRELRLTISDNGRGFDPKVPSDGNGIFSMRKRAATFGGRLTITSEPGTGTTVALQGWR